LSYNSQVNDISWWKKGQKLLDVGWAHDFTKSFGLSSFEKFYTRAGVKILHQVVFPLGQVFRLW
jgi:hypothetical protein